MKKMIYILMIVVGALLIVIGTYFTWRNTAHTPEKIMTDEFVVTKINNYISDDKSFSFSYPDFQNWKADTPEIIHPNLISNEDFYMTEIVYSSPSNAWSGVEPRIRFHKIIRQMENLVGKPNINRVVYNDQDPPGQKATFQTSSFEVEIAIVAGDVEGFSAQAVLDEIIKTFKTTDQKESKTNEFVSGDDSFAFHYPKFEKWTSSITLGSPSATTNPGDTVVSTIMFNPPESEIWSGPTPEITVTKIFRPDTDITENINPKRVSYTDKDNSGKAVTFQGSGFVIEVQITAGDAKGFSTQMALDKIIETFGLRLEDLISPPVK